MADHQSIPIRSFDDLSKVKTYRNYQETENLIIDYDDLSYVRIMKLFKSSGCMPGEEAFNKSIGLEDYYFSKETRDKVKDPSLDVSDISADTLKEKLCSDAFHLRFYFPKPAILQRGNKVRHMVIMFNGMDEKSDFLLYDTLGEYFTGQGMGAVLIPTPLHLNRSLQWGGRSQTPTTIAHNRHRPEHLQKEEAKNPRLFYYSFARSWFELQELVCKINNSTAEGDYYWQTRKTNPGEENAFMVDKRFYETYFGEHTDKEGHPKKNNIEFTILGYSLGGLRALSFFLSDIIKGKKRPVSRFHSCITINTCPDLKGAHTKSLGITKTKWENNLMAIARKYVESRKNTEVPELHDLREIFRNLYFPDKGSGGKYKLNKVFKERIETNLNNYLAIASGSDEVVDPAQIDMIAPDYKSIHKLTVAGVNHNPATDPNWQDLLPRVESNMLEFISTCDDLHYTKNEILSQIAVLVFNVPVFSAQIDSFITNSVADTSGKGLGQHLMYDFTNEEMQDLLSNIKQVYAEQGGEKMCLRFLKYYYLSKSFFPHFVQTIAKLNDDIFYPVKTGKSLLCKSDIIFEMFRLYRQKTSPQQDSPYPGLFGECGGIRKKLIVEYKECAGKEEEFDKSDKSEQEKMDDKNELPFYQFKTRLRKIGIDEGMLKEMIGLSR